MTSNYTKEEKAVLIDWVRTLMDQKGWSAAELARASGLAPSTMLRIFSDSLHRFDHGTLQKIASAAETEMPVRFRNMLH